MKQVNAGFVAAVDKSLQHRRREFFRVRCLDHVDNFDATRGAGAGGKDAVCAQTSRCQENDDRDRDELPWIHAAKSTDPA